MIPVVDEHEYESSLGVLSLANPYCRRPGPFCQAPSLLLLTDSLTSSVCSIDDKLFRRMFAIPARSPSSLAVMQAMLGDSVSTLPKR